MRGCVFTMAIRDGAHAAIHTASAAAALVSASPIPFSDSALLILISCHKHFFKHCVIINQKKG